MRKLLWGGVAVLILGPVGLYLLPAPGRPTAEPAASVPASRATAPPAECQPQPSAEETPEPPIEPIVVERAAAAEPVEQVLWGIHESIALDGSIVERLRPGAAVVRPDAGLAPRMPYADEGPAPLELLRPVLEPVAWVVG